MYDVLIIGAGVIGTSIARELAKYQLRVIVLDKENDVCEGTSCANSAIIHSGYDPKPGTLKAKLNVQGNKMYDQLCEELDVSFIRNGSITLANDEEELAVLLDLHERAKQNGVQTILIDQNDLHLYDKNITNKAIKGLLAPTGGIINPFELTVALMENAMDNGVELSLKDKVLSIETRSDYYLVNSEKGQYKTKYVINAAGIHADIISEMVNEKYFSLIPRRGEYYVLDHYDNNYLKHTLFNVPSTKGKGVLVSPTTHYNYIIGPSSEEIDSKEDVSTNKDVLNMVKEKAYNLVDFVDYSKTIRQFSGIRSISDNNDFIIEETKKGFINVAGIQSPGLSAAPAIAKMVVDIIPNKTLNPNFNPKRRPLIRLSQMSLEEKNLLIKDNPAFGRIICNCEKVTEGEIVDVIHRNCGATTVKGVKKRIRPGFGLCQGGFCEVNVVKILARELHIDFMEVEYAKRNSVIVKDSLNDEVSND